MNKTEKYFLRSPYGFMKVAKLKIKNGTELYLHEERKDAYSNHWWKLDYRNSFVFQVPVHWIEVKTLV